MTDATGFRPADWRSCKALCQDLARKLDEWRCDQVRDFTALLRENAPRLSSEEGVQLPEEMPVHPDLLELCFKALHLWLCSQFVSRADRPRYIPAEYEGDFVDLLYRTVGKDRMAEIKELTESHTAASTDTYAVVYEAFADIAEALTGIRHVAVSRILRTSFGAPTVYLMEYIVATCFRDEEAAQEALAKLAKRETLTREMETEGAGARGPEMIAELGEEDQEGGDNVGCLPLVAFVLGVALLLSLLW